MDARDLQAEVDGLMDGLRADLERLAAIPSIAFPGFPAEPVREAHDLLVAGARTPPELRSTVVAMCAFVRERAADYRAGTAS
ncbi:hypothetical protein [Streptomyces sp. NPDC055134]